jgi:acyl-CoA reductase-like NAD-dependent aldehyde dehydrogenase
MDSDLQSIQQARNLAEAAYAAWQEFGEFSADRVERVLKAVSEAGASHAADLARMAVEETGFGNVRDKTSKNLFASEAVYRAMAPLRTIGIVGEDREKRILEVASPVGVVAGVIPSTNPTSTVLYKALIALKGRNGIVFSPHPAARKAILATVRLVAEAAVGAGAPEGLVACMETPTLAGTRELMASRRAFLLRLRFLRRCGAALPAAP